MTTGELIRYLQGFDPEGQFGILIFDMERRLGYDVNDLICLTDAGLPVLAIKLGEGTNIDDLPEKEETDG